MAIEEIGARKPVKATKVDPVPSQRAVISEHEILSEPCYSCGATEMIPCRNKEHQPLAFELDSTELRFHSDRIMAALHTQVAKKFEGVVSVLDRSLIVYYAFNMLCDAVAANSAKLFNGKEYTTHEVQAFFAQQAITELRKDRLIDY